MKWGAISRCRIPIRSTTTSAPSVYWSRLYTSQLQEGMNYDKLAETVELKLSKL
jgi:hypothetical protein